MRKISNSFSKILLILVALHHLSKNVPFCSRLENKIKICEKIKKQILTKQITKSLWMLDKPEDLAEVTERPRFLPWEFDTTAKVYSLQQFNHRSQRPWAG